MAKRMFLVYLLVELAVLVGLIYTIGFGWTILAVLATFLIGLALAGSQVARHIKRLQSALSGRASSSALATDSALVALGAVLVVIPGLASTVLGALLLMPPTRRIARPVAVALVGKGLIGGGLMNATPMVVGYPAGFRPGPARGDFANRGEYVDGEVIDVVDVNVVDVNVQDVNVNDVTNKTAAEPTVLGYRPTHPD